MRHGAAPGQGTDAADTTALLRNTIADESAIRRLLASYCLLLDDGHFGALAELFTPDGRFSYAGSAASGRAAIEAWFTASQPPGRRGKHLTLNSLIEVDGNRATVTSDYLWLRSVEGVISVGLAGRYRDALVRVEDAWLLARREAEPMSDMEPT